MKMSPETTVAIMIAWGTVRRGIPGLLRQRRHRVESEERQAQDRRARQDRAHAACGAVAGERRHQVDGSVAGGLGDCEHQEHHDEDRLDRDDQEVGPRDRHDADDVEHVTIAIATRTITHSGSAGTAAFR